MGATEDDNPEKADIISNLGVVLDTRFKCVGERQDLEEAVSLQHFADSLTPDDSPNKLSRLSNLAGSILLRFKREGRADDLEEVIGLLTRVVELVPDSHVHKPGFLNNLGLSHQTRFEQFGNTTDLENSIALHARTVELTPDGHPDKPSRLDNSANSLTARFMQLGKLEDLENAVVLHARAVELTPDGHPEKPSRLSNSGSSLEIRFERLGNLEDLGNAIVLYAHAVELTPDGHPNKQVWLNNLAASLTRRYERTRDLKDLEKAIVHQSRAVDLTSDGHPRKPTLVHNLGAMLQIKFKRSGSLDDMDQANTHFAKAVILAPEGYPNKPTLLYNLGNSLQIRFHKSGNLQDMEEAIRCSTQSVELLPKNHAELARILRSLGILYETRLRSPHAQFDDATHAMDVYLEAMQCTNSHPLEQLRACDQYAILLSEFSHLFATPPQLTLLDAYKHALGLVPQCIWLGNNVRGRYTSEELPVIGVVVNNAVTAAISAGEYGLALEWVETGRAVVWSQVLQLRAPLDDLRRLHPQLANDLDHVSQTLQYAANSSSSSLPLSTNAHKIWPSLEGQTQSSHTYALEYDKLITRIRDLDGFEDFLRPKNLSQFIGACTSGPVVVINVHEFRSDALVLHGAGDVVHVSLPDLSFFRATDVQSQLWDLLRAKRFLNRSRGETRDEHCDGDDRGGRVTAMDPPDMMRKILADLWNWIVKPIMDVVLTLSVSQPSTALPHVTWCPTGPITFLPLHAAGIYPKHESPNTHSQTIMDIAVSSYTPTLEALLKPRTKATAGDTEYPKALVVSQPATPNCDPIPNTRTEAGIVMSLIEHSTPLDDTAGTIQAVLESMATHDWVHLACHGVQNRADPTNSAFALYDGKLTLSMLMSHHLPNADLAVLSACQTATGDEKLSEEAVHLSAGMLNVGYKSVVGTMWSISDYIAPEVMRVFYTVMAEQVKAGGELRPAYALHEATKALRNKPGGMNDFLRWVPFVHFGLWTELQTRLLLTFCSRRRTCIRCLTVCLVHYNVFLQCTRISLFILYYHFLQQVIKYHWIVHVYDFVVPCFYQPDRIAVPVQMPVTAIIDKCPSP
ncbi:CHAT domain-containing protein [Irpex rosettiformis]|uniref:CHAT domain-containing protein n=1 Tax=Irpex rosettiformis TaxID=378272 RepID=A0ACB8TMT9_9APHY|nr:CHAT domain-containing protein [Irpex rosettiformis]